jgi:hypothetical protein
VAVGCDVFHIYGLVQKAAKVGNSTLYSLAWASGAYSAKWVAFCVWHVSNLPYWSPPEGRMRVSDPSISLLGSSRLWFGH